MSEEEGSFLMDLVIAGVIVGAIVGGLSLYSGVWPPLVVVESGSMMHQSASFGRVGTIDPGDLVLVTNVDDRDEVVTFIEACRDSRVGADRCRSDNLVEGCGGARADYGNCGDVVVYDAGRGTPIIHRAMAWVDLYRRGSDVTYTVEGYGVDNASAINIPSLGLSDYKPTREGYITKGDSRMNFVADQAGGVGAIATEPVGLDDMIGKAQGELPWFGLIKLAVAGNPPSCFQHPDWTQVLRACAPVDLWVMLGFSVAFLIFLPNMVAPIYGYVATNYGDRIKARLPEAIRRRLSDAPGRPPGDGEDPGEAPAGEPPEPGTEEGDGGTDDAGDDAASEPPDDEPDEGQV